MREWLRNGVLGLLAVLWGGLAQAQQPAADLIVTKQTFELPSFTTVGGQTIQPDPQTVTFSTAVR
jgi:hypothetical protein